MSKLIKLVIGFVITFILVGVAAVAVLTALFDPNDYKPEIEALAKEQAQIDLTIGGDIDWSFYPWLGLKIADIDARFTDRPDLATLQQAQLAVNIPSLLSGKVQMDSILIDGLTLTLSKNQDGNVNWEAATANTLDTTSDASTDQSASEDQQPLALDIQSISIKNSTINYIDQQTQQQITLSNVAISSGKISDNSTFPIELSATLDQKQNSHSTLAADIQSKANVTLDLANQRYTIRDLSSDVTLKGEKLIKVHLESDIVADLSKNTVTIDNMLAQLSNLTANGQVTIEDLNTLQMSGSLQTNTFALNSVLEELGIPVIVASDNSAFNKVLLSTQFQGDAKAIKTDALSITLDDTKLKGSASYMLETGRADIALSGNSIDIDRYLPPSTTTGGEPISITDDSESKNNGYSKEAVIPVDTLKPLNIGAALKMQSVTYNKMPISNVDIALDARNGLIKLNKLNVTMYGGSITSNMTLDARKTPVSLTVNEKIAGLQLGELLTAVSGDAPVTGALAINSSVTASGTSVYDIVNTLNGTADISLTNGVVKGIDMAQQLCQTMNNISALGQLSSATSVDGSTPFAKMGGNFTIKNGVISNNNLAASLDAMNLTGKGSVSLPKKTIDYGLGLMIQENLFKQSCSVNNKLEGVEWPVLCKGSFNDDPASLCKPDTKAIGNLLKAAVTDKIKEKVNTEVQEKIEEKLKDKLGGKDAVKGLLKGLL